MNNIKTAELYHFISKNKDHKMKIAYFMESLPPNTDGVAHTYTQLAETLEEYPNIEYRFYSPFKPDSNYSWANKVIEFPHFQVPFYKDYKLSLPLWFYIKKELDAFKPDIIHLGAPSMKEMLALRYARKNNIPVVGVYHTHFVDYVDYYKVPFLKGIGWKFLRWFFNSCDINYVPAKATVKQLEEKGFTNMELWQRGINVEKFNPKFRDHSLREEWNADEKPILLFVGRLVKEKDVEDLIEASEYLTKWGCSFQVVFVGDGPMRKEIENRCPNSKLLGFQHGEDLSKWYATSDIFVFPSTTETFGNVIQEASASGIPSVVVDKGGVQDHIRDKKLETGLIARANEPEDFARKIKFLLDNKSVRENMGQNARTIVEDNTWAKINGRLIDSYKKLINKYILNQPSKAA